MGTYLAHRLRASDRLCWRCQREFDNNGYPRCACGWY